MTALARLKTRAERQQRRRQPPPAPTPAQPTRHVAKIAQPAHDETPTAADNT